MKATNIINEAAMDTMIFAGGRQGDLDGGTWCGEPLFGKRYLIYRAPFVRS